MAQQIEMDVPNNSQRIENILQLNDDCLFAILRKVTLMELCEVADTCKRLQNAAGAEFVRRQKSFMIVTMPDETILLEGSSRILRNFGNLICEMSVLISDWGDSTNSMISKNLSDIFNWLDRYCSNTLKVLIVLLEVAIDWPPVLYRVMTKMEKIVCNSPFAHTIFQHLRDCKELVELEIGSYKGPFFFTDHHFPHLERLSHCLQVDSNTDFEQMKTFFENHPKLIFLRTEFFPCFRDCVIDLSFIAYLLDLEELNLVIKGAEIVGVDAFANLKKLKRFAIHKNDDERRDGEAAILERLSSVDSLVELELGFQEFDFRAIFNKKYLNLSELEITSDYGPFTFTDHHFPHLQRLSHCVRVDSNTDFEQMKTFFANNPKLVFLRTEFFTCFYCVIDLSFIAYLLDLEELNLVTKGEEIMGINAFVNLKKLKKLTIHKSSDVLRDAAILERLSSVDSLVKLELGFADISHMIAGIQRFKNLSELSISTSNYRWLKRKFITNISCLAQLKTSRLTALNIECKKLLEPKTIIDVIRHLREIRVLKCFCEIKLTESICKRLENVCSSQRRHVEIILCRDINKAADFSFIRKFNKEHRNLHVKLGK